MQSTISNCDLSSRTQTAIVRSNIGLTQKRQKEDEEDSSPGAREGDRDTPGPRWRGEFLTGISGGPLSTDPSYRGVRHEYLFLSTNTTLARKRMPLCLTWCVRSVYKSGLFFTVASVTLRMKCVLEPVFAQGCLTLCRVFTLLLLFFVQLFSHPHPSPRPVSSMPSP